MKGIDKKACRSFLNPRRSLDLNSGLFYVEQIEYIVCTAIRIVGHRKLLILDFYPRAEAVKGMPSPDFTMFQATDDLITFDHRDGVKTRWRTAILDNLERTYNFIFKCAFYSRPDEERVIRFCKAPANFKNISGFGVLNRKQSELRDARSAAGRRVREKKIADRMKPLRPMDKRMETWIKRNLLPQYIFYKYQRNRALVPGRCSACGQTVEVAAPKHNLSGVCPSCGASIRFKSMGRQKRIWDRTSAQIIQRLSEQELVIRVFKAHRYFYDGEEDCSIHESARLFVNWDDAKSCQEERFYNSYDGNLLTPWKRGNRPRFSYWQENFDADLCAHLYTRNLPRVLAGSPWEYCQIAPFYLSDRTELEVIPYLAEYLRHPFVEYLIKLKLFSLAAHVIYHNDVCSYTHGEEHIDYNGKKFQSILKVGLEYLPLLQKLNVSYMQLGLIQGMLRCGLQPDEELLDWCGRHKISRLRDLLVPLSYTTPHKMMRYIAEQYEKNKRPAHRFYGDGYTDYANTLVQYRDYLCMCEGLEYDLKNSFVLFPRDLKDAHDKVASLSDPEKAAIYERQIQQAYPLLEKLYRFERDGWTIMAPKTSKEITEEGHRLHHCVGGYVKRVAMKECIILFLRRTQKLDKPVGTIEVIDNAIVQARGYDNGDLPADAKKFLTKWEAKILKNTTRQSAIAQNMHTLMGRTAA